jgi:molecular chaperone GrpE
MEARLRRTLADLDNLRKRVDREIARERAAERAAVAARWLNVVDNLDRALEHAGSDSNALVDGVRAVRDEAVGILAQLGFPRYEDVGRPFDPGRHEALSALPADAPPGTVLAVIRPGYGSAQNILRPAGVVVSRGPAPADPD